MRLRDVENRDNRDNGVCDWATALNLTTGIQISNFKFQTSILSILSFGISISIFTLFGSCEAERSSALEAMNSSMIRWLCHFLDAPLLTRFFRAVESK